MGPINIDSVKRAHKSFFYELNKEVDGVLRDAESIAYANVWERPGFTPRTHALQEATKSAILKTGRGKMLRMWNRKPYALAIDQGAHPHFIFARRKKFLRFRGRNGKWVTKGGVRHPGNKPYRFLGAGITKANVAMEPMLLREMNRLARRFNKF